MVSNVVISLTRCEKRFLLHSAPDYNVIITTHTTQGARANKELSVATTLHRSSWCYDILSSAEVLLHAF